MDVFGIHPAFSCRLNIHVIAFILTGETGEILMNPDNGAAVVLAAGKGSRMRSGGQKVMAQILGSPMLAYILAALEPIFGANIFIVVGHEGDAVRKAFPDARFIVQSERLGTGHAVGTALPELEKHGFGHALVINGDTPLVETADISRFMEAARNAAVAFATITLANPRAYGRVLRVNGNVAAIVEARDYNPAIHGNPGGEINAGLYWLDLKTAAPLLGALANDNESGEYYLTDIVGAAARQNIPVLGLDAGSDENLLGVNTPFELVEAEETLRAKTARRLLDAGTLVHAPTLLRASPFCVIEPGVEITAPCEIYGASVIRAGAIIESHCVIRDCVIESGARIRSFCHLENASVGAGCIVGPYARLRPQATLEAESHVGNFVELKKTRLGRGSKANHLSYLGDAEIGAGVNIGAGTITCNYDGKNKFATQIGDAAFIGSNTALVAPVRVGSGALVGAGSVITRDVPDGDLAIARERQKNLPRRKG